MKRPKQARRRHAAKKHFQKYTFIIYHGHEIDPGTNRPHHLNSFVHWNADRKVAIFDSVVHKAVRFHFDAPRPSPLRRWLYFLKVGPLAARRTRPKGLLLDLLMPPSDAENALFNILGRYQYWVGAHGEFWAKVIFFSQSTSVIVRFWAEWLLKHLKLIDLLRKS